jgi:hypothetical protein
VNKLQDNQPTADAVDRKNGLIEASPPLVPIPNYTLAEQCPACGEQVVRHACKVRCERCGFVWDCSEL